MTDYKALYYRLLAAAADATEAIEKCNYGTAQEVLIKAQQEAEEMFMTSTD